MRHAKMTKWRLGLPLLVLNLLVYSAGCAHEYRAGINCPEPSYVEVGDYEAIVRHRPDRPAVRWVGRLVAYCWPGLAELERRDADSR